MTTNGWLVAARPLLIGHRGASLARPENSLAAFALALQQGADGLELDVQLSADGQIAIVHDADLRRLTGNPRQVSQLTAAELRREALGQGETIPMLPDLLELLGDQTLYNIELKHFGLDDDGLTEQVVACVKAFGLQRLTLLSAFNPWLVRRARRLLAPDMALALLRAPGWARLTSGLVRTAVDNPHHSLVSAPSMAAAAARGQRVFAWTVDDPAEAQRLVDLGVNGIITNDPGALRAQLVLPASA